MIIYFIKWESVIQKRKSGLHSMSTDGGGRTRRRRNTVPSYMNKKPYINHHLHPKCRVPSEKIFIKPSGTYPVRIPFISAQLSRWNNRSWRPSTVPFNSSMRMDKISIFNNHSVSATWRPRTTFTPIKSRSLIPNSTRYHLAPTIPTTSSNMIYGNLSELTMNSTSSTTLSLKNFFLFIRIRWSAPTSSNNGGSLTLEGEEMEGSLKLLPWTSFIIQSDNYAWWSNKPCCQTTGSLLSAIASMWATYGKSIVANATWIDIYYIIWE